MFVNLDKVPYEKISISVELFLTHVNKVSRRLCFHVVINDLNL